MAVVQYTFIHKQYTEQHNETEYNTYITINMGYAMAQLVEALLYKPEGHGFDSRLCHRNFLWT